MSHARERRDITQEGLGGKMGISGTVKRVRQGKTSCTRHSFFCGHYGSISEVDPANVMWESQLQITAETYHKACGSPWPIQTISLLLAQPSHHSQWCWTYCRNKVRKTQKLLFVMLNVFQNFAQPGCHSQLSAFMSLITFIIAVRSN